MSGNDVEEKMKIEFSVLMSVYKNDSPEYFAMALDSVLNQSIVAKEIVLVVDGPIPLELQNVIKKYKEQEENLCVYPLKKNVGLGNALNYGLHKCKYDFVARMDSDDLCVYDRFEKQIECFKKYPELSIVGGFIDEFAENPEEIISYRKVPITMEEIYKKGVIRSPFNHVTVMYKKQDIIDIGGYQEVYLFEDYYLWIRLIEKKLKAMNIPEVLVHVRVGNGMLSRRGGKKYFASNKFLQDYMLKHKMIPWWKYCFNVVARWSVQVGMPCCMRQFVYQFILRKKKKS